MSKSKTFKLSSELTLDYNTDAWHSSEWGWEIGGEVFPDSLYEVEVTFTKKNKELTIGELVEVYDDEPYPWQGKVLWFDSYHALINQNFNAPKVVKRGNIGL